MLFARRTLMLLLAACAALAVSAAPSSAIVGGNNASQDEYPSVAKITFGLFSCTGTLIAPDTASVKAPTKVAGAAEGGLWAPSTMETIAGWGTTSEGGSAPSVLQEAQVPITTDDYCSGAYDDFESTTMVCAGYPQGGVDTCQGDSGGPMFGRATTGELRVVGATSFGEGCARAGKPGVYARVGDTTLREWIRGQSPAGVN